MGWTERKEILTSFKSIMNYIEKEDSFHDYRIGTIHYLENEVELTIEEVIPGAKIQDSTGFVWDFHFKGVTFFQNISRYCYGILDLGSDTWKLAK